MRDRDDDTWRQELAKAMREAGDPGPVVARAPDTDAVWDRPFDGGYGSPQGEDVLAWTDTRVYFPVVYDGSEWLDSAPRNPQPAGQEHVGSW